jgi:hypothetical protein
MVDGDVMPIFLDLSNKALREHIVHAIGPWNEGEAFPRTDPNWLVRLDDRLKALGVPLNYFALASSKLWMKAGGPAGPLFTIVNNHICLTGYGVKCPANADTILAMIKLVAVMYRKFILTGAEQ